MNSPLILALDTNEIDIAKDWVSKTNGYIGVYKLGLEFFLKFGRAGIAEIAKETDAQIFLDLKLHDIPNTVGAAVKQVADLEPRFLTVHATGGVEMIQAAANSAPEISITAVTILTSLSEANLAQIGFVGTPEARASELALLAVGAGARAIVSSPLEIAAIRRVIPDEVSIITPGIRPKANNSNDDQRRTMDAKSAILAGANFLVIGRPITSASDVSLAAKEMYEEVMS